jgi:hypothetical protein
VGLSEIRTQIKAVLEGVSGIGSVHEYDRWFADWGKLIELFKTADNKIIGWMITRRKTTATRDTMPTIMRDHTFLIRGVYGLKDSAASELVFQDLVEAVQNAFDSAYLLGGNAINSGPMQITLVEIRMFGSVLCHYAELEYPVSERVEYN